MREYSQFVHNMKVLDINQSWELFNKKAFAIDNVTDGKCPEELQIIGKEILKWCGGLPLAISVVGGLLQKRTPCKSEWEKVVKEMKSHLNRNESINTISSILELSYQNLPPELKACFLSLGLFKEDDVIKAKNLVHIWVAQELAAQEVVGEEETMEDVATDYLNQLIIRNMVQVMVMNCDEVKYFCIHDLLRDLSQRKAKEDINMEILIREEGDSHHSLHKPRHRAIHYNWERLVFSTNRNQHLRSLFIHGRIEGIHMHITSYWKSCELLRVLDLRDAVLEVFHPKAIGALTGLRYIKMRHGQGEFKLPRSWGKLTNLQVPMPVLERLPQLLHLKLFSIRGGEKTVISHQGFPSLKVLRLQFISYKNMQVETGGMPELKQLFFQKWEHLSIENLPGHLKRTITQTHSISY